MPRRRNTDWNSMVLAEVKERVRQYQRTWFNNRLRPGKIYEKLARELLATLHLSTRRENVVNLQLLLANLWVGADRVSLLVPMHPTHWTGNRQRRTTSGMPRIIKHMLDAGYIDRKVMGRHVKQVSRIWCSPRLLKLFSPLPLLAFGPVKLIVLKDANDKSQDFAETEHTRTLRKRLKKINRINGRAKIGFTSYRVRTQLHAVYNKDFTRNGRLYTSGLDHFQGLEGWKRRRLMINGEPVVELDFSGYYPHLLYAMEGVQFAGDPYDLGAATEHPVGRRFAKTAFQCLLNNKNWTEAQSAVNHWAYEHDEIPTLEELGLYPARKILRRLERRHKPIRHCFAGRGPQLANLEARIALNIVLHFTNQGIPCLPVHDSFLVQERYETELRRVMLDTYKEYANGFTIPIQKKVDL